MATSPPPAAAAATAGDGGRGGRAWGFDSRRPPRRGRKTTSLHTAQSMAVSWVQSLAQVSSEVSPRDAGSLGSSAFESGPQKVEADQTAFG